MVKITFTRQKWDVFVVMIPKIFNFLRKRLLNMRLYALFGHKSLSNGEFLSLTTQNGQRTGHLCLHAIVNCKNGTKKKRKKMSGY